MPTKHPGSLKTRALGQLQQAMQQLSNENTGVESTNFSRRKFIRQTSTIAAAAGLSGLYSACKWLKSQPEIAIVGGGMAGLHAAYILKQAGLKTTIYEGSSRPGGRIFTIPEMMGTGLWTEMGGEFIDSNHTDMINLAGHFKLPLLDRHAVSEKGLKEYACFFGGRYYDEKDILEALRPYALQLKNDAAALSDEISWQKHTAADKAADQQSITAYIDQLGIKGWFRDFILTAYLTEYGMEPEEQSSISFLSLFNPGDGKSYQLFGLSDERFSIIGGGQLLCDALAKEAGMGFVSGHMLTAISQNSSGKYQLHFETAPGQTKDIWADIVLITIPFSTLRNVDIKIPLPEWKLNSIHNLGYGTISKLFVGVNERVWRKQGFAGYAFADNGITNGYDHTQLQNGNKGPGGYTIYLSGKTGAGLGARDMNQLKEALIPKLNELYPGVSDSFNERFIRWDWPGYLFSKGSYMAYKTGQYTTLGGTQFAEVGNLYFAGEHCSYAFQGFMNGAAETGRKAAENIIRKLRK